MTAIIDTNENTTAKLSALKAAGMKCVIRYIGSTSSKEILVPEAKAISEAGLSLALVYEAYGDTKGELTGALGTAHATFCLQRAPLLGAPDYAAIYFAVDNDDSAAAVATRVTTYFTAIKAAIGGKYRIGVYGSGRTCAAMLDVGLAELAWLAQSKGWAGYSDFLASNRWSLAQRMPQTILGLDTDPDDFNPARPDFGSFVPFLGLTPRQPTPGPTPSPVPSPAPFAPPTIPEKEALQRRLNTLVAPSPGLAIDGDVGDKTIRAMIDYVNATAGK